MFLKKVHTKSIGLFLGKLRKMTSPETSWTKEVKTNHVRGTKRTVYRVEVPSLKVRFTAELLDGGTVIQIPTDVYLSNKVNAKKLEKMLTEYEVGKKND